MSTPHAVDDNLVHWDDVELDPADCALLVGNGASMAVWERFKYETLYQRAHAQDVEHRLSDEDVRIFDSLETFNFEEVLHALMVSSQMNAIVGVDTAPINERYRHIREALIDAVCSVHIPPRSMNQSVLERIGNTVTEYDSIYSTNYDLILYWAFMSSARRRCKDYFWKGYFDSSDTNLFSKCSRVMFVHGALHLYEDETGKTWKRAHDGTLNLLELFRMPVGSRRATPLFITEGDARQKKNAIQRSDYLNFVYREFEANNLPLVVFGHSLSDEDKHLRDLIRRWGVRKVAIGVYPQTPHQIIERKNRLQALLPRAALAFFDSTTHPLGAADIRIPPTSVASGSGSSIRLDGLVANDQPITEMERLVIRALSRKNSRTIPELAAEMGVPTESFTDYIVDITDKLGVWKMSEVVEVARDMGLLED